MSLLHILILLSAAGAGIFFFAGWLARPRTSQALANEVRLRREAQAAQAAAQAASQAARTQLETWRTALDESKARLAAEEQQGRGIRDAMAGAERDRDTARAELQRLSSELQAQKAEHAREKGAADLELQHLRQALDEQKAEHARQSAAAELELPRLRQALDEQKTEVLRLAERERAFQASLTTAAQDLAQVREQRQRFEAEVKDLTASLRQAEESQRQAASVRAKDQADWQQKYQLLGAQIQAKASASQAVSTAKQDALLADVQRLTEALSRCKGECDVLGTQNRDLQTKHRVLSETLATMESSAGRTRGDWQEAQVRLRELDQLRQENANLREEKAHAEVADRERATHEDDVREVRVQLAAAQAKLSDLERLLSENRKLRDEVADLRLHSEASVELERLSAEHKHLRLDAELMARRLQELLQDQAELADLRARFHDLQSLGEEVAYLRRREKDLEARLYASGAPIEADALSTAGVQALHTVGTDMEASLHSLVQPEGVRSAVLADTQGFLIASAGEPLPQEGMAAFAAIATEMVSRTRALLPLAEVDAIRVSDTNRMVLTCRLFETGGQGLGVATLGPGEPSSQDADRVVSELAVAVAGKSSDSEQ